MLYLTDKFGDEIEPTNPLAVDDISVSHDRVAVAAEAVSFRAGNAGVAGIISLDKAPVADLLGARVGSYWRNNEPLLQNGERGTNGLSYVSAVVETATAATVTIVDPQHDLEQLLEPTSSSGEYIIVLTDGQGDQLYGWINAVAESGTSYTIDVYNSAALATQSWVGTLASFEFSQGQTRYAIYKNTSSLVWVTGTILTREVAYNPALNDLVQLSGFSNGDYAVDYFSGRVLYKKATNGVADTVNYNIRIDSVTVSAGGGGAVTLTDDDAFLIAASQVTPAGYLADEAAPDSVNEGDVGVGRMTLDRRILTAGQTTDDAAPETGTRVNMIGGLFDDTATDSVDEGDAGFARISGDRKLIGAGSYVDDGAFTPAGANSYVKMIGALADEAAADSVDEGDAGALRMTLDRRLLTAGQSTDDAAPETGTRVNAIGALADEAATDSVDEGDLGFLRMTLDRRLLTAGQTTDDAAPETGTRVNLIGAILDDAATDSVDEGDAGFLRMSADRRMLTDANMQIGNADVSASNGIPITTEDVSNANSVAYVASLVIKGSAGKCFEIRGFNSGAAQWVQVHDAAALPADATVPEDIVYVGANQNFSIEYPRGKSFGTGIVVCNSSTGPTKTIGAANCWFSAEYE